MSELIVDVPRDVTELGLVLHGYQPSGDGASVVGEYNLIAMLTADLLFCHGPPGWVGFLRARLHNRMRCQFANADYLPPRVNTWEQANSLRIEEPQKSRSAL